MSLYPHWSLPFTPSSAIHKGSGERKAPWGSLSSRDGFSNQSNQSGMQHRVEPPQSFLPQQQLQALLCSDHKPLHCPEYLIPRTQERETVCHHWPQHLYGPKQSCPADVFAKGRGPQKPSVVSLAHGNTEHFPSHLPPAASLARLTPSMQSHLTRMLWRLKTLCRWRGGVCSELTGDGYSMGLVSVGELAHRPSGTYS